LATGKPSPKRSRELAATRGPNTIGMSYICKYGEDECGILPKRAPRGQTEFQVNLKLGLTPCPRAVRQTWYASHRQRRFARFLGFLSLRGPDPERIPSPGPAIPTRRREYCAREIGQRASRGASFVGSDPVGGFYRWLRRDEIGQMASQGSDPKPLARPVKTGNRV